MSDPADERAAYRAALANAEAAAIAFDENGRETPAELEPEAVPVQASDQPLPVETATADTSTEPTEPVAEPTEAEETPEQLRAQLAALEARIGEKDSMIGRQSAEVGEVRQTIVELQQQLDELKAKPAEPQAARGVTITQELIDSNPAAAVQAAYAQQNEPALQVAFEAWKGEDEFAAQSWLTEKRMEQREAALRAEIEATRQELQQLKEPLQQQSAKTAAQADWNDAFVEMQQTYPEFIANAEKLLQEVAPQFPAIAQLIANGDKDAKVQGLTLLYEKSKLGDPEQLRAQLEQEAVAAAAEAAAATAGAAVVTSQTTAGQPSVVKSDEELEAERYIQRIEGRATLASGWTGRQ